MARAARDAGFRVLVVARLGAYRDRIAREGFTPVALSLHRGGLNPLRDAVSLLRLIRLYARERPTIVHHVALKPVLYGSLAARLTRVPGVVNALAGMGYVFLSRDVLARLLRPMVRAAFRALFMRPNVRVILQNCDDRDLLVRAGAVRADSVRLIAGSGVDLAAFSPSPEPTGPPVIMLVSRMLWDKGVGEFVEAAQLLTREGVRARFVLVGDTDPSNPAAIPGNQLRAWGASGVVEWWGHREDVAAVYAQSHVVCLPSYREGLPKVLIEAAASGRPMIATNVPGCREVVRHGGNGYLVPARDATALAGSIRTLVEDPVARHRMGQEARLLAEREFGVERVVQQTLAVWRGLLP